MPSVIQAPEQKISEGHPDYSPTASYGFFGYRGAMLDRAMRSDDAAAIRKAHELDWIDRECVTLGNDSLLDQATKLGKTKVEAALTKLGYPRRTTA